MGEDNIFVLLSFDVKLRDSNDLSILQNMAEQYHVEIFKEGPLPLWYELVCILPSSSHAMDIANRFYESGKFESASPSMTGVYVSH